MKISKSVQRRTVIFAALAVLFALVQVTHLAVQSSSLINSDREEAFRTYIGEIDTSYSALALGEYEFDAITITRDADGEPLVEALPTSLMLFSDNPAYTIPEHYGRTINRVIFYLVVAVFVIIVLLVGWILFEAIKGFRTGNIFRRNHPVLLRWLALATFIYYVCLNNRHVLMQYAVSDIFADNLPIEVLVSVRIDIEAFIVPLLLLIFAELMAVAARINEEESMTI